ncbi:ABC transporter ATP-binding protein [Pusillimonas noertemannii]|uniref:Amino acid/amide ABC transporter ATP-binding protein 1 (HAAT family) n=1 Tax=Pusillimonas noertemannii TaxID=305977 RepID=A0A2U1CLE6_9BURK|nr:ABC transporter ATP-binding protein [Pusillimonas noertemannii]NYT69374.1 ABC transporter ATP-binding protein [Pusillimonas noertemannii]PVY61840.1 amino acid/amide ABC transporter ATP-binding protein 1 (HAAT family) [Pusillimonas noertemannii]TFL09768.1 ABC transporter ATP-binding protein [Pusillimonas noertemannii]
MSELILELKGVDMQFGGLKALSNISMSVRRGEFIGIIGPNGAGKTTLFNAISGVIPPTAGEVRVAGRPMQGRAPNDYCKLGVARTFQTPRIFPDMTVRDNVRFAHTFGNASGQGIELIEQVMHAVGMAGASNETAGAMPPARQRQLEIAMALATSPRLLLLDEVAAGLTEGEVEEVARLIQQLRGDYDLTVVWIEHAVKTLMKTVERVAVLNFGELIADGTPEQVAADQKVIDAYLGEEEAA